MPDTATPYMFDNAAADAALQVHLLAEILDPHTRGVLEPLEIDIDIDGTCLELGAGAGTIATFVADQLVPGGRVTVIDTDPRHVAAHDRIDVQVANVVDADLGEARYDLIHARLLLMHLPERREILARAVQALKPGGYVVISDWDCTGLSRMLRSATDAQHVAFRAFQTALIELGESRGMDPAWALGLPDTLIDAGLTDVDAIVHNRFWRGGQPGMQLHACNSRQLEQPLLAAGVTAEQLGILRTAMHDPAVTGYTYPMVTAVGRRP